MAASDRGRDVAGEHRLEAGVAAADQRQRRRDAGERRELVEEIVLRPEQDRGPQDGGGRHGGERQLLAHGLGARIMRGRVRVGADRRDVDEARPEGGGRQRDRLGPEARARNRNAAGRPRTGCRPD